jgi:hypothetical protein
MEDMKFGICRVNDPVNSSTFGIVYRKACALEFRYRDINRLPSFEPVSIPDFGRFLLETKTMGLGMGICFFSFTGAIIP